MRRSRVQPTRAPRRRLAAFAALLALAALLPALPAEAGSRKPKMIAAKDLRPGMKGYGLTVMRGQKIERFEIEVIGVLPNKLPGQDMILVRCSGLNLEHTGVIAGMSGSPVFVKGPRGKDLLMGAVSYAFPFNKDPVAGVTPIASMWPELSRPLTAPPKPQRIDSGKQRRRRRGRRARRADAGGARFAGLDPAQLRPIAVPVSVAGFHPDLIPELNRELAPLGFGQVQAAAVGAVGASGGSYAGISPKSEPFKPGSALSLSLVRGDMTIAGVGTVTWVHKDRFIAFGHPFRGVGQIHLPVGNAHIVWVTASQVNSFKMGVPLSDLGVLDQDRLPAVAGRIGPKATMVPMTVRVRGKGGGVDRKWKVEVVDQPKFFPLAVGMVLGNALRVSEPIAQDAWVKMKLKFELEGGHAPLVFEDMMVSVRGSAGFFRLRGLAMRAAKALVTNGFKRIRTRRITAEFEIGAGRPMAFMEAVRVDKEEVRVGERPVLHIDFLRPNTKPVSVDLKLPKIPKELAGEKLSVWIGPAPRKPVERPPPKNVEDVLASMRDYRPRNRLVAVIQLPGRSWMIRGERLVDLPPSVTDELTGHRRAMRRGRASVRVGKLLPWTIEGSGRITLQVADDE